MTLHAAVLIHARRFITESPVDERRSGDLAHHSCDSFDYLPHVAASAASSPSGCQ
jgi:hypothetical protein